MLIRGAIPIGKAVLDFHSLLYASTMVIIAFQLVFFHVYQGPMRPARIFYRPARDVSGCLIILPSNWDNTSALWNRNDVQGVMDMVRRRVWRVVRSGGPADCHPRGYYAHPGGANSVVQFLYQYPENEKMKYVTLTGKSILAVLTVSCSLSAPHGGHARTYVHGRRTVYERAERLLEGQPWKDRFLRDRRGMFGHLGSAYHDYYLCRTRRPHQRHGQLARRLLRCTALPGFRAGGRFIAHRLRPRAERTRPLNPTEENIAAAVAVYTRNVAVLDALCDEFDIVPLFLLQPLLVTKRGLTKEERTALSEEFRGQPRFIEAFYRKTRRVMEKQAGFVDLSGRYWITTDAGIFFMTWAIRVPRPRLTSGG